MKKRTALIGALLSFIPLGQPLMIGTSAVVMLSVPNTAKAETAAFYYNRGIDKKRAGDYYGAIEDYNKAIQLNPRYANAYINRGNAKSKLNDEYGAIADYNKAIELNPTESLAYKNRGISKENLGDLKGACADWREATYRGAQDTARWVMNQC